MRFDPNEPEHVANYYRGFYINEFSRLELLMSILLSRYFNCNPQVKNSQLFRIVIDRMTFENKRTSLKLISQEIEEHQGFIKTKNNKYPHKEIFDEIRIINEERVRFAHYPLEINAESLFGLWEWRDDSKIHEYSKEDIHKAINRIFKSTNELKLLFDEYCDDLGDDKP